ncbi:MAG: HlyD family type I secretion periplasmic adaptor subunit [Alphaproteobacteria bacterium]|nr:HlyD family type I secretion periplasmic adaptor subunit [Alphaproteobacteria bacterium]
MNHNHTPSQDNESTQMSIKQPVLKHVGRTGILDEPYVPRLMQFSIVVITLSLIAFIAWAGATQVDEVTRAEGDVVPNGYVQVVQHLEGGIVKDILVKEGQMVEKGQVLISLNGAGAAEDLAKNKAQLLGLRIEAERLRAFLDNRNPDFALLGDVNASAMKNQQRYFDTMLAARNKEAEVIRSQINQKKETVRSLQTRQRTLGRNLKLAEEGLAAMRTLLAKGLANRFRYLSQQEDTNIIRGQLAEVVSDIKSAKQGITEYEQRLASLSANYHDQASQQLHDIESQIAQLKEVTAKTQARVARLEVRSPRRGLVKGLEVHTIGGVFGAGEKLLEIVPMDEQMVVEAKVSTTDVGHVRVGQPVQIKVHSYDFVRYGMVPGTLESISPMTFVDKFNKTYYRAKIILQQPYVGEDSRRNLILPGMTVEADIMTGTKTVMDYLLKPIHVAVSTAMQER